MPSEPTCWCAESDEKPKDSPKVKCEHHQEPGTTENKKGLRGSKKRPRPRPSSNQDNDKARRRAARDKGRGLHGQPTGPCVRPRVLERKRTEPSPTAPNKKEEVLKVFKCATSTSRVNRRSHSPRTRRLHPLMRAQALVDFEADAESRQGQ